MNEAQRSMRSNQRAGTVPSLPFLQRKCACGNHTTGGQTCSACSSGAAASERQGFAIGEAGDRHEQEADRIADRAVGSGGRPLQRAAANGATPAPDSTASVGDALHSPAQSLDGATRTALEPHFGESFSNVRVHVGETAARSAAALGASAYTVGRDIVFGVGSYQPRTSPGRHLIAHELAHVVQQRTMSHSEQPLPLQRDLARPPTGVPAPVVALTPTQIQDAIAFNETRFRDPYSIVLIRDVLGVQKYPAVVDEELIKAIVDWQAARRMTQDGKVGHTTTRSIFLELVAERQFRDAIVLLMDSYALPFSFNLRDVEVRAGLNCCFTRGTNAAGVVVDTPADAVTRDVGTGNARTICVCRTSIPTTAGGYDHFVRILLHELVHVPQRAAGPANNRAREFDAFFAETCAGGRAPVLSAPDRVVHANIAIGHFNAMPAAFQTPARIAQRNQLNALVAAGGVGPC